MATDFDYEALLRVAGNGLGVAPGGAVSGVDDEEEPLDAYSRVVVSVAERLGPAVPIGRAGTADEVAEAVMWLLSPHASYVTGSILEIGGGR